MTETSTLTRRQAREIERRTGVRPMAVAGCLSDDAPMAYTVQTLDHTKDTGEIQRNWYGAFTSVIPEEATGDQPDSAEVIDLTGRRAARETERIERRRKVSALAASSVAAAAAVAMIPAGMQAAEHASQADLLAGADEAGAGTSVDTVSGAAATGGADTSNGPSISTEGASDAQQVRTIVTSIVPAPESATDRDVAGGTAGVVDAAPAATESAPAEQAASNSDAVVTTASGQADANISTGVATASAAFPMPGGYVNEGFGTRGGSHMGLDIVTGDTCGASIVAAASGTVTSTGYSGAYGNMVVIRADDGTEFRYAHILEGGTLVSLGETVSAGQSIALAGNTGRSYGCHLHFEILQDGSNVDPEVWLANRGVL